ncbi:hypothetical protein BZA05DRAFT_117866 [Tricharina praecox]|uniref:uncharacterized protein n=1 Tax=Tricharina praecox TaxID=43433 RepID=UPI00221FC2A8|nr:uncharacterized protein BZA05DRAFT_117866 [Tricharina praecox]KAI5848017.1 hypothetical protein BZA05DRAFT_117866 [Tricharina praecox]
MPEPVTITISAVGVIIALTSKILSYISSLQRAGVEHDALLYYFEQSATTLRNLRGTFEGKGKAFPVELLERYTRELRRCENDLDNFDAIMQDITRKLGKSLRSRIWQKSSLANGDTVQLERKLNFFNQNLAALQQRLTFEVVAIIHEKVADVKAMGAEVNRAMKIDMGVRYGPAALKVIQGDGWQDDDAGADAGVSIQPTRSSARSSERWRGETEYRTGDGQTTTPQQAAAAAYGVDMPAPPYFYQSLEPDYYALPRPPPPPIPPYDQRRTSEPYCTQRASPTQFYTPSGQYCGTQSAPTTPYGQPQPPPPRPPPPPSPAFEQRHSAPYPPHPQWIPSPRDYDLAADLDNQYAQDQRIQRIQALWRLQEND